MVSITILHIPAQHPAFDGHFPGAPLLPGVVLLDEILEAVRAATERAGANGNPPGDDARALETHGPARQTHGQPERSGGNPEKRQARDEGPADSSEPGWTIASAKFLHPVRPGETLTLEHEPPLASGAVRFTIRSAGQPVASGTLIPKPPADESEHQRHGHQAR
jgi:3-hydroxyacyl-[acyl-carrier-protein] dehydratase